MNNEKNINTAEENTKEETIPIIYLTFYNRLPTGEKCYIAKDGVLLDGYLYATKNHPCWDFPFADLGYGIYTFIFFKNTDDEVSYDYKIITPYLAFQINEDKTVTFVSK